MEWQNKKGEEGRNGGMRLLIWTEAKFPLCLRTKLEAFQSSENHDMHLI